MLFIKIMATIAITSALLVLAFGIPYIFDWIDDMYVRSESNSIKEKVFYVLNEVSGWVAITSVIVCVLSLIIMGLYMIWN